MDPKTFKPPVGSKAPRAGKPAIGHPGLAAHLTTPTPLTTPSQGLPVTAPSLPVTAPSLPAVPSVLRHATSRSLNGAPPQTLSFFDVYSYNYNPDGAGPRQATCQVGTDSETPGAGSGNTRTILYGGYHACGSAANIEIAGQATLMDEPADNVLSTAPSYYAPAGANAGFSSSSYYDRTSDTQFERILFRIRLYITPGQGTWAGMGPAGADGQQNCTGFGTGQLDCYIYSPSFPFIVGTGYDCSNTLNTIYGPLCVPRQDPPHTS